MIALLVCFSAPCSAATVSPFSLPIWGSLKRTVSFGQLDKPQYLSKYWDGNVIYQVAPDAIVIFLGISLDWHHESESHESNKNNAYEAPREKRDNVLRKQFHVTWYECCSARRAKHVTIIKSEHSQIQSCPCYHSAVKAPAVLLPPQRGQPLSSMSRPIRKHS